MKESAVAIRSAVVTVGTGKEMPKVADIAVTLAGSIVGTAGTNAAITGDTTGSSTASAMCSVMCSATIETTGRMPRQMGSERQGSPPSPAR
ncbi:MAG: hypothetical protein O6952_08765 [Planctomycetota bacterium]|nr:hypothetical protein [Planctomycetota bacterium]